MRLLQRSLALLLIRSNRNLSLDDVGCQHTQLGSGNHVEDSSGGVETFSRNREIGWEERDLTLLLLIISDAMSQSRMIS